MYPQFDEYHHIYGENGEKIYTYGLVKINDRQYMKCDGVPCCRRGNKRERRLAELEAEREAS